MAMKQIATSLNESVKEAFTFPFDAEEHCKPDGSIHYVYDRNFHLDGHLVVLDNTKLFPGLTFRALEANTGDLNIFSQDVKFEIDIPTIGGYFYVVSEKITDIKFEPKHIKGSFKINYDTAIVKGITSYFVNGNRLAISSMALDFELVEKPKVTLYSHEDDGLMSVLDSDRAANGAKIAEVLWPNVQALLYWILRDKLWKMGPDIGYNNKFNRFRYDPRRMAVATVMNDIIVKLKRKLRAVTTAGRLPMPDIDLMVKNGPYPEWGRFKATSGWLGNVATIRSNHDFVVHARSKNELVLMGQIYFNDWKYCYDEYMLESSTGGAMGEIVRTLRDNDAFIEITAIRDENGKLINKHGRFVYINATNVNNEVTGLTGASGWIKSYIHTWMYGLMDAGKPALNDLINKCLNEVLEDIDLFGYWDELQAPIMDVEIMKNSTSQNSIEDEDDAPDEEHVSASDNDSVGSSVTNGWEII